jgi:hypothetical protein
MNRPCFLKSKSLQPEKSGNGVLWVGDHTHPRVRVSRHPHKPYLGAIIDMQYSQS